MSSGAGSIWVGAAFAALGLIVATDFRGFTRWHVRATFFLMGRGGDPLPPLPPLRQLLRGPTWDPRAGQVWLERVIGAVFAVAGIALLVSGVRSA